MYLKGPCVILALLFTVFSGVFGARRVKRQIIKTASVGGRKILECNIVYPGGVYTPHVIKWNKKGIDTPVYVKFNTFSPHIDESYKDRIRLVEKASIELSNIKGTDEGWYECIVNFMDGTDTTTQNGTWIYLSVNAAPEITQASPSLMQQHVGTTITIYCESTGTPNPILIWKKNGKELQETDRIRINRNRVFLKDLQIEDGGVYACHFENIVGEATHTIKVIIEGGTYIVERPKNASAREGQRIKFSCKSEAFPSNITYRWFKDNVDIQLLDNLLSRTTIYADGGLLISMLTKTDSGWYKCRPTNGMGMAPEAQGYLNVTYVPRVLSMPAFLYLPKGMRGEIRCPVDANPPVTQVLWTKNNHGVNVMTSQKLAIDSNWTLIFSAVEEGDAGRYTCTPYSVLGTGNTSPVVQVFVKDPPYFTKRPDEFYQKLPNQSVILPCAASGDPKPEITWRKAKGKMPDSKRLLQKEGDLTILDLIKADHGSYECVANNIVTSIITSTTLIIESTTPHAPDNVTVEMGLFSAKVSWFPAYDGGFSQHYVLWFKVVDENPENWKTMRVLPDGTTSFTLYNLIPDTKYEFSVLSRNQLGDGMFSKVVKAKTKGYSPGLVTALPTYASGTTYFPKLVKKQGPAPGPPRSVNYRWNGNNLEISWLPPRNTTVPVMYYIIESYENGKWVMFSQEIVNKTVFVMQGFLPTEANFQFRVISYGVLNASEPSSVVKLEPRTAEQTSGGLIMSQAAIWGIVGGLLFLLVAVIMALIAVKCFNQRREKKKKVKYGNVKYFGPKQLDATTPNALNAAKHNNSNSIMTNANSTNSHSNSNHSEDHDRSSGVGRSHRVKLFRPLQKKRVFVLHKSRDSMRENFLPNDRVSGECDNEAMLRDFPDDDDAGFRTYSPGRRHLRKSPHGYRVDLEHPIGRIERSPDGRFVPYPTEEWKECPMVHDVNDIITEPNVNFQPIKDRPCHEYPYHDHGYAVRGPYAPYAGQYGYRPGHHDGCSMMSNMGSLRSSTDWPIDGPMSDPMTRQTTSLDRTYLTSSPDLDNEIMPPLHLSDLSSVLPSSHERLRPYPSKNLLPMPPIMGLDEGEESSYVAFNPNKADLHFTLGPLQQDSVSGELLMRRIPNEQRSSSFDTSLYPSFERSCDSNSASRDRSGDLSIPRSRQRSQDRSYESAHDRQPSGDRSRDRSFDRSRDRSHDRSYDIFSDVPSRDQSHDNSDIPLPFERSRGRSRDRFSRTAQFHQRHPSHVGQHDRSRDMPVSHEHYPLRDMSRDRSHNMPASHEQHPSNDIPVTHQHYPSHDRSHDRSHDIPVSHQRYPSHDRSRDIPVPSQFPPAHDRSRDRSHDRFSDIPLSHKRRSSQDQSRDRIPNLIPPEFSVPSISQDSFASHDQYTPDEFRGMLPSSDDVFTIDIDQSPPVLPYQPSYLPRDVRPDKRSPYLPHCQELGGLQAPDSQVFYDPELSKISAKEGKKQVARVLPSPQKDEGSDSSGRPMEYTRDQLHGTIERIRNSQRARKVRPLSSDSALDAIARLRNRSPSAKRRPASSNVSPDRGSMYAANIAPYKDYPIRRTSSASVSSGLGSGVGSRHASVGMYPNGAVAPESLYPMGMDMPDTSHSSTSGIGSRNTSNSTASALPPGDNMQLQLGVLLKPPEDVSDDSSMFSIEPPPLGRDASVDENYEFDTENGLESDILDIIRQYHRPRQLSFDADRGLPSQVQPLSPEERCDKLREEFREFRRRQISGEIGKESSL
ncbi:uncharacterized protein LOC135502063 [Lineus longissimus]|uniref:uncharacterized protein LOC135502063 n=1 Tax=Lineus longissimus TaxID=88925 RepID=UPI00315C905C